jgi:hypothetical protein
MNARDASKRVPKSIDTGTHILGTYTLTDLAVGALPGIAVILIVQLVLPPGTTVAGYQLGALTLPLTLFAIAMGGIVVFLTPSYLTTLQWIGLISGFYQGPRRVSFGDTAAMTHIAALHPDHGVVERTDGTLLTFVQVTPPAMALATDAEWAAVAEGFQEFLNTTVDFPIQIYSTTQPFPIDDYLAHYETRRTDPDVRSNPRLARLIDEYVSWYRTELTQRRMTIRDHYIVIPVTPAEVRYDHESLVQRLTTLPIVGVFVTVFFAARYDDERAAMFDAIAERTRLVESGLREMGRCDAHHIGAAEAAELLSSFWRGEQVQYDDPEQVVSRKPLIRGGSDR